MGLFARFDVALIWVLSCGLCCLVHLGFVGFVCLDCCGSSLLVAFYVLLLVFRIWIYCDEFLDVGAGVYLVGFA